MEKLALKVVFRWCFGADEEGDSPHKDKICVIYNKGQN